MQRYFRPAIGSFAALLLLAGAACSSNVPDSTPDDAPRDTATTPPTSAPSSQSAGDRMTAEELVRFAEPSVVRVQTNSGVGSGFVVDPDGYIITNNHVVAGARTVTVTLSDGSDHEASIVGTDPRADLALLQIEQDGLTALSLADLDDVAIGQDVIAIGYALDLKRGEGASFSVTRGIVSQKNRAISEASAILGAVQTDAAINHGNSGGPLINLFGQVVGVNTALQPDTTTGGIAQGIGYAVGSDTVRAVYVEIREKGSVDRGFLGIQGFEAVRPADIGELNLPENTRGIFLPEITPDGSSVTAGPASEAGIRPGDVIVRVGEVEIGNEGDLAVAMIQTAPGETVPVELYRNGQSMTLDVTLGTPPQ
jgi:S1-C subfamily serine protease